MKIAIKEISLLVILPLILMSLSLTVLGTSHITNINRITKLRAESIDIEIQCNDSLCQDIENLENTFVKFEKEYFKNNTFV